MCDRVRAVFKKPQFLLLRTALQNSPGDHQPLTAANHHQPPPTANRHQPPNANRHQPSTATNRQPPPANRRQPPTLKSRRSHDHEADGVPVIVRSCWRYEGFFPPPKPSTGSSSLCFACITLLSVSIQQPDLKKDAGEKGIAYMDKLLHNKGDIPTSVLRGEMKETMHKHASVFRIGSIMEEGVNKITKLWKDFDNILVHDKSRVWNQNLVETLELRNLLINSALTVSPASPFPIVWRSCHTTPHHTTPHHITPHHTTPHHTTPHRTAPHHTTPHHTTPHHTTPHHTTPHHTTPHHTTPHHTTPHHTTPCVTHNATQ